MEWITNEQLLPQLSDRKTVRVRWNLSEGTMERFGLSSGEATPADHPRLCADILREVRMETSRGAAPEQDVPLGTRLRGLGVQAPNPRGVPGDDR